MPRRSGRAIFSAALAAAALLAGGGARAEPALWRVTDGEREVWLFGSVHLLPKGGFSVSGAADETTAASITLARAVDPDGRDLFELLGRDADRVRGAAEDAGIPLEALAMFEPWFAGLTVSVMALQARGYDVEHGVEQIIQAEAREEGKPGCGLETLDGQLGMLDGLSGNLQAEILLQAIDEAAEIDTLIEPMLRAWREGDEAGLETSLEEDFDGYPELAEVLIYERNARWAEQVEDMLQGDEDVLLVVGAMHLVGDRGLPALLRKRGLRVERR
jgi:uncharacterized protein YbaP (TraB family)